MNKALLKSIVASIRRKDRYRLEPKPSANPIAGRIVSQLRLRPPLTEAQKSELKIKLADRTMNIKGPIDDSPCLIFLGSTNDSGYGSISFGARTYGAHVASYLVNVGDVPDGLCVLHRCDIRTCTEPTHLFLGSIQDNALDMVSKGRHWKQRSMPRDNQGERRATIRMRMAPGAG